MSIHRFPHASFIRGFVLTAWVVAFVWLFGDGRYSLFLQQSLWPLLAGGLVMLILFLVAAAARTSNHLEKSALGTRWVQASVVLLPLMYMVVAPESGLGSHALKTRYVSSTVPLTPTDTEVEPLTSADQPPASESAESTTTQSAGTSPELIPASEPEPPVRVSLLAVVEQLDQLKGKRVITQGQVYHDEVPEGHFMLYRFVMRCCAADALPVAVLVPVPDPQKFEEDSWVEVEGRPRRHEEDEEGRAVLLDAKVKWIEGPQNHYLTPYDLWSGEDGP